MPLQRHWNDAPARHRPRSTPDFVALAWPRLVGVANIQTADEGTTARCRRRWHPLQASLRVTLGPVAYRCIILNELHLFGAINIWISNASKTGCSSIGMTPPGRVSPLLRWAHFRGKITRFSSETGQITPFWPIFSRASDDRSADAPTRGKMGGRLSARGLTLRINAA